MVNVSVGTCLENPARVTNHPGDHASHLKSHWGLKVVFCHEMLQQRCEVHNHLLTPGTWTSSLHDSELLGSQPRVCSQKCLRQTVSHCG